jgi:hypothetical protein
MIILMMMITVCSLVSQLSAGHAYLSIPEPYGRLRNLVLFTTDVNSLLIWHPYLGFLTCIVEQGEALSLTLNPLPRCEVAPTIRPA